VHIYIYLSISICISTYTCIYLSICLFIYIYICMYLSIYLSIYRFIYISVCLSVYLYTYLSIHLSIIYTYTYVYVCTYIYNQCIDLSHPEKAPRVHPCAVIYIYIYTYIWAKLELALFTPFWGYPRRTAGLCFAVRVHTPDNNNTTPEWLSYTHVTLALNTPILSTTHCAIHLVEPV